MKHQRLVLVLIMVTTLTYPLWHQPGLTFSKSSFFDHSQEEPGKNESDRDWVYFRFGGSSGGVVTVGYYEKTGDPITVTYVGCSYSTYLLSYLNAGLRPIPTRSKGGAEWIQKVNIKVYKDGNPMGVTLAEYKGRPLSKEEFVVKIKERRVRRIEYLHNGAVVLPTQFELEPNYGYRPKRDEYDDFRWVTEAVTEFPPLLDLENYAEAVIEILRSNGEPLGPGRYYITAEFDARDFDLKLPPSHNKIFPSSIVPFEVREVQTAEDRANYHYVRAQGFIKEKNLAAAEAELIAGTAARPDSTLPWLRLGEFYENQLKNYDKAIAAYKRAKAISNRKALKPPANNMPRMKRVDGKMLYDEPPYWPGLIERVREKKLRKKGS